MKHTAKELADKIEDAQSAFLKFRDDGLWQMPLPVRELIVAALRAYEPEQRP